MKTAFGILIVLFWAAVMGLLVRREVIPVLLKRSPVTYESLLETIPFPGEESFDVRMTGQSLGILRTEYLRDPGEKGCRVANTLALKLASVPAIGMLMKSSNNQDLGTLKVRWTLWLDSRFRHTRFEARAEAEALELEGDLKGTFNGIGELMLTYALQMRGQTQAEHRAVLECPPDALFGLGVAGMGLFRNLHVGKKWSLTTLDPLSFATQKLQTRTLQFTVESLSPQTLPGGATEEIFTVRAELGSGQGDVELWIDARGRTLRAKAASVELVRLP